VPVGGAVYTSAGRLEAKWVIHAVGPRWGEGREEEKLRSAVRNSLSLAEELGAKSIAFPAISTGIFGYPKEEGTKVLVEEVVEHLRTASSTLEEVRLVGYDEETVELFLKWAEGKVEGR
jgi:O-acetyl-ADP-ribose deacetylase (regulator of RNase III)